MKDFVDRVPQYKNRRMITHEDGTQETVTIELDDDPINEGTPINRENMMALQGFIGTTTTFNPDGSITETNADGQTMTTEFNADGSITETFVGEKTITKTTSFLGGIIREVVS